MNVEQDPPATHALPGLSDVAVVKVVGRHGARLGLGRLLHLAVHVQLSPEMMCLLYNL